ncbi:MFS transporter (plasmid) [Virgibacillus necropolis]|uniref:MFS transporter n=1 Tax=Virgibacillus necropolis TaxID=163877 RepID=UPI00384C58A2
MLDSKSFTLYWLGTTISFLGDSLIPVAATFAVLHLGGSGTDVSFLLGALWGTRVLFILAGGVWSDTFSRKQVIFWTDIISGFNHLLIGLAFFSGHIEIWHLILSAAFFGAASAISSPASIGLISEIVTKDRLKRANSLVSISKNGLLIFGPALAGFLASFIGYGFIFTLDAVTFFISSICLFFLKIPNANKLVGKSSPLMDLREGISELFSRKWLWTSAVAFALGNMVVASFNVLGPLIAEESLNGASDWGLIASSGAVGALLGALLSQYIRPKTPLFFSFLLKGVFVTLQLIALLQPSPIWVIMLVSGLASGSMITSTILYDTIVQIKIPGHLISRIDSIESLISYVLMPIGLIAVGPMAENIGYDYTLTIFIIISILTNFIMLTLPAIRKIKSESEESREGVYNEKTNSSN